MLSSHISILSWQSGVPRDDIYDLVSSALVAGSGVIFSLVTTSAFSERSQATPTQILHQFITDYTIQRTAPYNPLLLA